MNNLINSSMKIMSDCEKLKAISTQFENDFDIACTNFMNLPSLAPM
jgi:hypothetical protein